MSSFISMSLSSLNSLSRRLVFFAGGKFTEGGEGAGGGAGVKRTVVMIFLLVVLEDANARMVLAAFFRQEINALG
jgi:hypothetical protein